MVFATGILLFAYWFLVELRDLKQIIGDLQILHRVPRNEIAEET